MRLSCALLLATAQLVYVADLKADDQRALANFDKRHRGNNKPATAVGDQKKGLAHLVELAPQANVSFDAIAGSPRWISSRKSLLSGPNGLGKGISPNAHRGIDAADVHKPIKGFLNEHPLLFGHDAKALSRSRVIREFASAHNGLHTTVWQQEVDGIPVFEGVLIGHTTSAGELVNISSQFIADPDRAAKLPAHPGLAQLSARQAVSLAALHLGAKVLETDLTPLARSGGRPGSQHFSAKELKGEIEARLVWLPVNRSTLQLCREITLTRKDGQMFRLLLDAQSGEILVRHSLTSDISDATYRVFTGDSPSPFSPGHPTPLTNQPPLVGRVLITTNAVNTTASPNGWINDNVNETVGNNVDAHLDRNNDNSPDLPRPHGSPTRVFDFPLDLTGSPTLYADAAVVNVFYWCNWYHDKLYELGFTEAAGNFQMDNFGRGGLGGDPVQADVQDGGGTNNDDFSTPPDGMSPRMQLYLFTGPNPPRDGALDTEVILHENTHGLSWRRVGGGVGITLLQSGGLGEGWSDFYSLALLSNPSDDLNGNYPIGGYSSYLLFGEMDNYYFGIRRYPYTIDMSRNPLTLKYLDTTNRLPSAPPRTDNPVIRQSANNEVHAQGEIWCVTLWEARANLINKYGFAAGNHLILQLVTDGMNLSPPNPNFIEARDAIIEADLVNNGGANFHELWAAFAKRGMGVDASVPDSTTTSGVQEDFHVPDDLLVRPRNVVVSTGQPGGPFTPVQQTYALTNLGSDTIVWSVAKNSSWLSLSNDSGMLPGGGPAAVVLASINNKVNLLPFGVYTTTLLFSNQVSGRTQSRQFTLRVGQPDYFTESFDSNNNDLGYQSWTFTPNGSDSFYAICREPAVAFPTDPRDGKQVSLNDDDSQQITLAGNSHVSLYGKSTNVFFIGSNGYLTFGSSNLSFDASLSTHFASPRIAGLFLDLDPTSGGQVSWQQLGDRVAVTFENVTEYVNRDHPMINSNSFQFELFYDGRIRLTFLKIDARSGLVGLSEGLGIPAAFTESDFTSYPSCSARLALILPASATEGDGTLPLQGKVWLPSAAASNVTVTLKSSDLSELTLPGSITIPSGQTNGFFDLTVIDDSVLDGTQIVSVSATAPQYVSANSTIAIYDNETASLTLNLPPTLSETAGSASGLLSVSSAVANNVTVLLNSSAPSRLALPPAVILPAGSTSVPVYLTILDNVALEGPSFVTITAHVQNWSDAVQSIQITDDESPLFSIRAPQRVSESAGVLAGALEISLPGVVSSNVLLSLGSDKPSRLTVPAQAILLAGQSNVFVSITTIDNSLADGNQTVILSVQAPGFPLVSATVIVNDDETPSVPSGPWPPDLSSGKPLELDLQWNVAPGEPPTTYCVYAGTVSNPGPAQFLGSTANTRWHLSGLQPQTIYFWQIVAVRTGQTAGPVWQFTTAGVDHFEVSNPSPTQWIDQPFAVTVTAKNAADQTISNFVGIVDVDAFFGPAPVRVFSEDFENPNLDGWTVQGTSVVTASDFAPARGSRSLLLNGGSGHPTNGIFRQFPDLRPTKVTFAARAATRTADGGVFLIGAGTSLENAVVLFEFTDAGNMGISDAFGGAYFVPFEANRWYHITFKLDWTDQTLDFYVDDSLIEQAVPFRGTNGTALSTLSIYNQSDTTSAWDQIEFVDDYSSGLLPSSPTAISSFVNGSWTGEITVHEPHLRVQMQADDQNGHCGTSSSFDVLATNDISLEVSTSTNPSLAGDELTYTLRLFNSGPDEATGISVTSSWSRAISILSASSASGSCLNGNNEIVCTLSALPSGATALVSVSTSVDTPGLITNLTQISRSGSDANLGNNTWLTTTEVIEPVSVFISDTSVMEGDDGTTNATFSLRLNRISQFPVEVFYSTDSDSATAGVDFLPVSGSVVFMPGITNVQIHVPVKNDLLKESAETFIVILTHVDNGFIGETQGTATIFDNDPSPILSIDDAVLVEPASGAAQARFRLSLDRISGAPAQVSFSTADGSALAGTDYIATNGAAIIAAGETECWITVTINPDATVEPTEFFYLNLASAVNTTISRAQARGLIVDRDAVPCVSIDDGAAVEGDSTDSTAYFNVWLTSSNQQPVSVAYGTDDGTAVGSVDYVISQGVVTFAPGVTTQTVSIPIRGDLLNEATETFFVTLTSATNASLCRAQGTGRILDNDPLPSLRLFDLALSEGNDGWQTGLVQVALSAPSGRTVSVDFATEDGTALSSSDYFAASGTLNFPSGVTSNAIAVRVRGDLLIERDETFLLRLLRPTNAVLQTSAATVTILDDDGTPGVPSRFDWSGVPSPQSSGWPFSVSLTARDPFGNVASNFAGPVQISARVSSPDVTVGTGNGSSPHPLSAFFRSARSQVIYLADELGPARQFTSLALNVITPPGQVLSNWTIRVKHTTTTNYNQSADWQPTGWTTVYQTNQAPLASGWVAFPFAAPFAYNGSNSLLIDFSFSNSSYSFDGQCYSTATTQRRTLALATDGPFGSPLGWSSAGTNPPVGMVCSEIPNIRLSTVSTTLPFQPSVAGPFSNGTWSGSIQVQTAASNVYLWADDQSGHTGRGNTFNVSSPNSPPHINPVADRTTFEGSLLAFTAAASDSDSPPQQLTFTLGPGAPDGASISPGGLFAWQPTEAQGPGSYAISVRVTDNGTPPLWDETQFTITVQELNQAPIFSGPATRYVYAGTQLSFLTASDPDLPAQTLSFGFGPGSLSGMSLDPASGRFSWTPGLQQAVGTYPVRIDVSDNGTPQLSASRIYQINVLPSGSTTLIATIFRRDNLVELAWPTRPGRTYRVQYKDRLDATWIDLPGDIAAGDGYKLDSAATGQQRFYRVVLLP